MAAKRKRIVIKIPVYNARVFVFIGNGKDIFRGWPRGVVDECQRDPSYNGICFNLHEVDFIGGMDGIEQLIHIPKFKAGTVAHECVHAATNILEAIGSHPSHTNDETLAYLIGYMVQEIHKGIK